MNPGSDEAIAAGCTCPVIDNGYGRGCMGGVKDDQGRTVFVIFSDCPLHGEEAEEYLEEAGEDIDEDSWPIG